MNRRLEDRVIQTACIALMLASLLGLMFASFGCAHAPVDVARMSVTGLSRFESAVDGAIVTWTRTEQQRIVKATAGDARRELLTAHRDRRDSLVRALDKVTACRRVVATQLQPGPDVPITADLGPPAADLTNAVKALVADMRASSIPVPEVQP